jgi:hypothetical protein
MCLCVRAQANASIWLLVCVRASVCINDSIRKLKHEAIHWLTLQAHLVLLRFVLLCSADTAFYKLKACGSPASSQSIGAIFPTA